MTFEACFNITVMVWEGGSATTDFQFDGRTTKYGISSTAHPDVDILNLTKEQAKAIYKKEYWDKVKGDDLPQGLRLAVWDYAVNSGVSRASRCLQKAVGASVDGVIGKGTLGKVLTFREEDVVKEVSKRRCALMMSACVKYGHTKFVNGWSNRLFDIHALSLEDACSF